MNPSLNNHQLLANRVPSITTPPPSSQIFRSKFQAAIIFFASILVYDSKKREGGIFIYLFFLLELQVSFRYENYICHFTETILSVKYNFFSQA